ncbi:MAG: UPF0182 family protein [Thermoanaerobacteraceae bacterium]
MLFLKNKDGLFTGIFIVVFLIIGLLFSLINLIVDFQWFINLGYLNVFTKKFFTQLYIGVPIFIVIFFITYFYTNRILKDYVKYSQDIAIKTNTKKYKNFILAFSVFIGIVISIFISQNWWFDFLFYINSVGFNIKDPIFNKDIGFYMFKMPFLFDIYNFFITLLPILIFITVILYGLMYLSDKTRFYEMSENDVSLFRAIYNKDILMRAFKQVAYLGFAFFITLGFGYFLKEFQLLYSKRGIAFGAGYTDVHVSLLFYKLLILASLISGVLFLIGALKRNIKFVIAAPSLIIIILILAAFSESFVQGLIVSPNELEKEKVYLSYDIKYTKKAFNLDKVTEKKYDMTKDLTAEILAQNQDTIDNIRINDYRPVKQIYNQLQGIRLYYKFNDIDIDRYVIDGKYRQVFLAAREIDQDNLASKAKTWINLHLKYTHGYGAVMSLVNAVTPNGQPDMIIKNIPPYTTTNIKIDRPEIYYGEMTNNYVIANTKTGEFDYPSGDQNVQTNYKGNTGIPMTFINRILYTIYTKDIKILLSADITHDSKMLLYRNIEERAKKIVPFLIYDDDPYLVIDNGKLYWIIDAYTYSGNYPYSQPYENTGINYIRNSVKVIIDAYNGNINYYISDAEDPIIKVYNKIFPTLFKDIKDMPGELNKHLRYPQFIFDIQSNIYKNYHMSDPQVFYNKEDAWDIAKEKYTGKLEPQESQYIIMKLPGETKEEYILMIPYTPATKDNMVSWLAARMDKDNYGKLIVYKFPKNTIVYGPMQIENMINQDPGISKELSLWNQQGSNVIRGNLLTIPIDDSMLYVEPLYIQSENQNSLPEVKRVLVAYKDQIVMENTLKDALESLFGINLKSNDNFKENKNSITKSQILIDEEQNNLIKKANETYQNALKASQNGNWTEFGKYMDELKTILEELNKRVTGE